MHRRSFILKAIPSLSVATALTSFDGLEYVTPQKKLNQPNGGIIPEFTDARSKKVMFVAHCILNQNARINTCAYTPAAITPVIQEILKRGIGIVQMPCPGTQILGLDRGKGKEIYELLSETEARKKLQEYAQEICGQVKYYQNFKLNVLGVLGIDGSPCCGVDKYYFGGEKAGTGAFMEELKPLMAKSGPPVSIIGVEDAKIKQALEIIDDLDKTK